MQFSEKLKLVRIFPSEQQALGASDRDLIALV